MKSLKISSAANIPHKKVSGQVPGKWNTFITLHPVTNTVNAKTKQLTYRRYTTVCFDKHIYCVWKQNCTLTLSCKENVWLQRTYKIKMYLKVLLNWNIEMCTWVRNNSFPDDRDSRLLRNSGNQRYTHSGNQRYTNSGMRDMYCKQLTAVDACVI